MDLGALFIGGSLLFIAGVVLASVVGAIEVRKLKAERDYDACTIAFQTDEADRWREAYNSRTEQLEATRIALVAAQKNDNRDERGRFVRA